MSSIANDNSQATTTSHRLVIPFYIYAAVSFLAATILLIISADSFNGHYFHPSILAITHTMALGWGTMMILGASHQLLPVLLERKLYSLVLGYASFALAAIGIPLLVFAFYHFDMGIPAQAGGVLINLAVLCFVSNIVLSMQHTKQENVHAIFLLTASLWLLLTTMAGLLLVYNFTYPVLPKDSLYYLSLHAHLGIGGWFILTVIGVGSRLLPMFLVSDYSNHKILWAIFILVNTGLIVFSAGFIIRIEKQAPMIAIPLCMAGITLFIYYCLKCYRKRLRHSVDSPMRLSVLSIAMIILPLLLIAFITIYAGFKTLSPRLALLYGFTIFFGWLTAIILGMTFKTLPFIIWTKIYGKLLGSEKTPNPQQLFNSRLFYSMSIYYLIGFILFIAGLWYAEPLLLKPAAVLLLLCAFAYNLNVFKLISHTKQDEHNHKR